MIEYMICQLPKTLSIKLEGKLLPLERIEGDGFMYYHTKTRVLNAIDTHQIEIYHKGKLRDTDNKHLSLLGGDILEYEYYIYIKQGGQYIT